MMSNAAENSQSQQHWHTKYNGNKWLCDRSMVRRGFIHSSTAWGHVLSSGRPPHYRSPGAPLAGWVEWRLWGFTAAQHWSQAMEGRQHVVVRPVWRLWRDGCWSSQSELELHFVIHQLLLFRRRHRIWVIKYVRAHTPPPLPFLTDTKQEHNTHRHSQISCQADMTD